MEEILRDIEDFDTVGLNQAIIYIVIYSTTAWILRPRTPPKTWWKHWKALAVVFVIIWLILGNNAIGRPFIAKENFNSLTKVEGIFQHSNDEGFFVIPQNSRRHFYLEVDLCTNKRTDFLKYLNQSVTVWQKNHIVYQFEYDGNVIYSLERSNEKVWLGVISDFILNYIGYFSALLMLYFATMRWIKNMEEGIYSGK